MDTWKRQIAPDILAGFPTPTVQLAMRVVSLGKALFANFSLGPRKASLPVVVAQPNERFANRTQKRVLCVGVV